jgi:hypothetical protein
MMSRIAAGAFAVVLIAFNSPGFAWEHAGHMTTAAIAFEELERARPEVIDHIGMLLLKHPDIAPFWVAANEAKGKERVRRMFIECARWPDDSKFTPRDMGAWHTARWAITVDDAPDKVSQAAEARGGKPAGQALEALELHAAMLANPETSPSERALALCWVLHIVGDIHQPLHASDLFSEDFPTGNAAGALSYVEDPVGPTTIPLHVLWDGNAMRVPTLANVDGYAQTFPDKHPRSSFPELKKRPFSDPGVFEEWARESYQIAVDWAYDIDTTPDPAKDKGSEEILAGVVNFILNGISPVEEAPEVPDEYWQKLQLTAEQRITLAGYRIADIIIAAADNIEAQTKFVGR